MICKFMTLLWVINKTSTRNLTVIKWPFSQFSTKDSYHERNNGDRYCMLTPPRVKTWNRCGVEF